MQVDSLEGLLVKFEKNLKEVVFIILDMQNIYIEYLNQANKVNKKCDEIRTYVLELEQELILAMTKKNRQFFSLTIDYQSQIL